MSVRTRGRVKAAVAALVTASVCLAASGCLSSGGSEKKGDSDGPLEFLSLAWQPGSMKAVKSAVKTWNSKNPDDQVKATFGDWGSVDDELITAFEGGKEPDIIHYEAGPLKDFVDRGNIADISEFISDDTKNDIRDSAWEAATYADKKGTFSVPFLQETQVIFVNTDLAKKAHVKLPTVEDPWTWDEYQAAAKKLTKRSGGKTTQFGASFPLKNPTDRLLNLGPSAGAKYFDGVGKDATVAVGDNELYIPEQMNDMLHKSKTADPDLVNASASDSVPGFLGGRNATLLAPIYLRSAITEGAKKNFHWDAVPIPAKDSLAQGSSAQTYSVTANSAKKEEAVKFIEYLSNPENQTDMALGDWLIPTSQQAAKQPEFTTEKNGWDVATATGEKLEKPPFQDVNGIEEWTARVANPAFSDYFSGKTTSSALSKTLTDEGGEVLKRYQR